jgi:hypothetical protein
MCNGNTDMFTFSAQSPTPQKPTIKSNAKSMCVDWDTMKEWTLSRTLDRTQHALPPDSWKKTAKEADES